jgi:hypothetical protein
MTVSFIGVGHCRTKKKPRPVASHRQTLSHTKCCTPHPDQDLNSQHQW